MMKVTRIRLLFIVIAASVALTAYAVASRGEDNPAPSIARDPAIPAKQHADAQTADGTWRFETYRNVKGQHCLAHRIPHGDAGTTCLNLAAMLARDDIYTVHGGRQLTSTLNWDNLFGYGYVSNRVKSLQLVSTDCSHQDIALDESRAFQFAVGKESIERGVVPYKLVARDAAGAVVDENLVLKALPRSGREAGLEEPAAEPACT